MKRREWILTAFLVAILGTLIAIALVLTAERRDRLNAERIANGECEIGQTENDCLTDRLERFQEQSIRNLSL